MSEAMVITQAVLYDQRVYKFSNAISFHFKKYFISKEIL